MNGSEFTVFCFPLRTLAAIEAGKDLALANKETLIAGGPVVLPLAKKHNIKILPADSEHRTVFQVKFYGSSFDFIHS